MRLSSDIAKYIKSSLKSLDPGSEVYLFGSRTEDNDRGGDIDILWLTQEKRPNKEVRKFRIGFYKIFGWQKIDIVNFTFGQNDIFKEISISSAAEI